MRRYLLRWKRALFSLSAGPLFRIYRGPKPAVGQGAESPSGIAGTLAPRSEAATSCEAKTDPFDKGLARRALRGVFERLDPVTTLSEVEESRNEQNCQRDDCDGEDRYVVRPTLVA